MTTGSPLLRMLEPAVRPSGLPNAAKVQRLPIESQSFDELLETAKEQRSAEPQDSQQVQEGPIALDRVFGIENASLRQLMTHSGR